MNPLIMSFTAALLALLILLALIVVVLYDVVNGKPVNVPDQLGLPATLIVGFFFGQHAATNGAQTATNAAITHIEEVAQNANATVPKQPSS